MSLRGFLGRNTAGPGATVDEIHEKFISVTFTLVGTTQGLAMGALAQNATETVKYELSRNNGLSVLHCLICFLVIARVTQTYICAAISYVQKMFTTIDLLSILLIGFAQYWIISSLKEPYGFGLLPRVGVLAIIAVLLHAYALARLYKYSNRRYEIFIQLVNMGVATSIAVACFASPYIDSEYGDFVACGFICVVLAVNIHISLSDTDFSGRKKQVLYDTSGA